MSRLPLRIGLLAVPLFSTLATAKAIAPRSPNLLQERPLMNSGLISGRSALGLDGGGATVPGQAAKASIFAFVDFGLKDEERWSGWTAGIRASAAENNLDPSRYLSPGTASFEAVAGRSSLSPQLEKTLGVRGFLEIGYRRDKRLTRDVNSAEMTALIDELPESEQWIVFRSGAGSDAHRVGDCSDSVESKIYFRSFISYYLPLGDTKTGLLAAELQFLYKCPFLLCGLSAGYDRVMGPNSLSSADPLSHLIYGGLRFERAFHHKDQPFLGTALDVAWSWVAGKNEKIASGMPYFRLLISKSF